MNLALNKIDVKKIKRVLNKRKAAVPAPGARDERHAEICEDAHRAPPAGRRPINLPGLPTP
jgi:hypothetical protein